MEPKESQGVLSTVEKTSGATLGGTFRKRERGFRD